MIKRFQANPEDQYQGRMVNTVSQDTSIKKTTDIVVSDKEHWKDVDNNVFRSLGIAIKEFSEA